MSDRFRTKYRGLTPQENSKIEDIKAIAGDLERVINSIGESRETSLAMTNLEQTVMWAVKAITK